MEERIKKLELAMQNVLNRVNDLETMRNPDEVVGKVCLLEQQIDEIRTLISDVNIKLNAYLNEDKFIEIFSDEEFKQLYMDSGLVAKDVSKLIEKKYGTEIDSSVSNVSKIINGQRNNLELRSYLGKIFRYECSKRKVL